MNMYNSFVGTVLKMLTGSAKNAGRLVVQASLTELLLENYAMAADLLRDTATASAVRSRSVELADVVKGGMEHFEVE